MQELYTSIFGNIQTWYYILAITYMIGLPLWYIWKKFLMHKEDKK
jgi:hypothetical protein